MGSKGVVLAVLGLLFLALFAALGAFMFFAISSKNNSGYKIIKEGAGGSSSSIIGSSVFSTGE